MQSITHGAFTGVRVFDLTQGVAGPYCTMLMAAQGADVIKVEPLEGDWLRRGSQQVRGHSPAALAVNMGKRSIALDLKDPAGRNMAVRLANSCDLVVESFRPGIAERLELGPTALCTANPAMVYGSIFGFGRHGNLSDRPVIDHIAQAYSGWMTVNADSEGRPQRTRGVVLADQITGLYAFQALASAFIRRLRFGQGGVVDITLAGSMAAFMATRITSHMLSGGHVSKTEFMPPSGDYQTKEGWLVLAVQKPGDVERLCALLDCQELLANESFSTAQNRAAHAAAFRGEIARVLTQRTALEWEQWLAPQGVMACVAQDIDGFLESQAVDGLDLVERLDIPDLGSCPLVQIPGAPHWPAQDTACRPPGIGEHSRQILEEIGATPEDIAHLLNKDPVA